MFTVIYSFEVKAGLSVQFKKSWQELTDLIYHYEGSLGSRLHIKNEHLYIAYAQWPSKKAWEKSGDKLPEQAIKFSENMKEAYLKIDTLYELDVIDDRLKDNLSKQ